MALDFFTPDRPHFFRPLTWGRRELIAACLKALHETLYGPGAMFCIRSGGFGGRGGLAALNRLMVRS